MTVKRNGDFFHTRIPRIKIEDVNLSKKDLEEIDDRRHVADISSNLKNLYFLPYYFNENAEVENKLEFIDENLGEEVFSLEKEQENPFLQPLQRGDKIIAVDGIKINGDPLKTLLK